MGGVMTHCVMSLLVLAQRTYALVCSTVTDRFGVIYLHPVLIVTRLDSSPIFLSCLSCSAEYYCYIRTSSFYCPQALL